MEAAQYGLGAALFLPYIPQSLDTEWNQGCQPSQLQGGEGFWLCHQVLPGTCSGLVVLRESWHSNTPRPHPSGEAFSLSIFFFGSLEADNTNVMEEFSQVFAATLSTRLNSLHN